MAAATTDQAVVDKSDLALKIYRGVIETLWVADGNNGLKSKDLRRKVAPLLDEAGLRGFKPGSFVFGTDGFGFDELITATFNHAVEELDTLVGGALADDLPEFLTNYADVLIERPALLVMMRDGVGPRGATSEVLDAARERLTALVGQFRVEVLHGLIDGVASGRAERDGLDPWLEMVARGNV